MFWPNNKELSLRAVENLLKKKSILIRQNNFFFFSASQKNKNKNKNPFSWDGLPWGGSAKPTILLKLVLWKENLNSKLFGVGLWFPRVCWA